MTLTLTVTLTLTLSLTLTLTLTLTLPLTLTLTLTRHALALDASSEDLEAAWNELDRRWMDCKMPIQIVHDIETGYGDPLRVKATPVS